MHGRMYEKRFKMEVTMETDIKRQRAMELLNVKSKELGRIPKRTDFNDDEVCFIKQKLGPWPRALEAAELKEKTGITSKEKSKIKRERIRKSEKGKSKDID